MNERATNDTDLNDENRQRDLPARADGERHDGMPGRLDDNQDSQATTSSDGKMTTADLAYGRNKDEGADRQKTQSDGTQEVTLIQEEDAGGFRERWTSIQTHFIDEPRETVSDADELVAEVIQSLATRFAAARQTLEEQWQSGSDVSTEDLRVAMQQYRSFFERLLAA